MTWSRFGAGIGLLLLTACAAPARREPAPSPPVETGQVAMADGTRLFYRKFGNGPRAVILPASLFLAPAFDRLAEGRTLLYYDMRNRGRSDSLTADRANSIQQDVADLEAIRAHFALDSVDLVGFSYLGLMVVLHAMEHPERVRRIVQIGPVPMDVRTTFPAALAARDYEAPMDTAALAELRRLQAEGLPHRDPRAYCEREQAVTRVALVGNPAHVSRLNDDICTMPNEWPSHLNAHFARAFPSIVALGLDRARVSRLPHPVLTIHGTEDRNAAYGGGREWAMTLAQARLLTLEGAAHCAWADDPDRVFAAIDAFLGGAWPEGVEQVTSLERPAAPR